MNGDYEKYLGMIKSVKEFKKRRRNVQSNVLKQKKLHEQFFNQIEEVAGEEKYLCLRDRSVKRETESLIMVAKIDKTRAESKCRLCGKVDETVGHIVCGCPMLEQREYKRRHGWVGRKIYWEA